MYESRGVTKYCEHKCVTRIRDSIIISIMFVDKDVI